MTLEQFNRLVLAIGALDYGKISRTDLETRLIELEWDDYMPTLTFDHLQQLSDICGTKNINLRTGASHCDTCGSDEWVVISIQDCRWLGD